MKRPPGGYRKWPSSQWKGLLNLALPVLSDLETCWTLGGGTGLFLSLNHRISYDIDIFPEDPSISQFINVIETEDRLPDIYDSVTKVLKIGMR